MRQPRQVGSALQGLAHSEPDRAASALLIVGLTGTSRPPLSIGEQGEVARWPISPPGWIGIWRRLYEFNGSAMWSSVTIIIVVAIVNPEYYNVQISKERRIDQKKFTDLPLWPSPDLRFSSPSSLAEELVCFSCFSAVRAFGANFPAI
ncbi:hypothetical protein SCUP515_04660 [Seiridium cupressi]